MTEYLTTEEIADRLRVTPQTVRLWIGAGDLPAYRFGKIYRVEVADFEAFQKRSRVAAP